MIIRFVVRNEILHWPAPVPRQTILLSAINPNRSESEARFFSRYLVLKPIILGEVWFFWVSSIKATICDRL